MRGIQLLVGYMPAEQLQEIMSLINKNNSSQELYYEDGQKLSYLSRQFQIEEGKMNKSNLK